MDSSDSCLGNTPPPIKETAENITSNLLPKKSNDRYTSRYNKFKKWCADKKVNNTTENILLAYFDELSRSYNSSTLWSTYSMLKTTLNINDNLDISQYKKLKTYIKRKSEHYIPKKSEIFTSEEINKFLQDAPNDIFLMMKIVFVIGISGACRTCELVQLELNQIQFLEEFISINIPNSKNNLLRTFIISNELGCYNFKQIFQQYINLRPKHTNHLRLFVGYNHGKCNVQPVGINTIAKIPSRIAKYLKKDNIQMYTGHAFRRTSAALLLANEGGDLIQIKKYEDWKSSIVADYIERSRVAEQDTAEFILQGQSQPHYSDNESIPPSASTISNSDITLNSSSNLPCITNAYNCNITINLNNK